LSSAVSPRFTDPPAQRSGRSPDVRAASCACAWCLAPVPRSLHGDAAPQVRGRPPARGRSDCGAARGASEPVEQREGFLVNGNRNSPHIVQSV